MNGTSPAVFDAVIIGAGPAGLNAAQILGRCRRRVVIFSGGPPRNAASRGLHGFLSRDGILPEELLKLGRDELRRYPTVELREEEVVDATRSDRGFAIEMRDGSRVHARTLLLATGVVDELPQIAGIETFYGRSVFHCPYCDGFEVSDQPIAVYGKGHDGYGLALELTLWSRDLVLCTDGTHGLSDDQRTRLDRLHIAVREERIAQLEGQDGSLEQIVFSNGDVLPRRALFFDTAQYQRSSLPRKFGCEFTKKGAVRTGTYESTNIPGLFVAGDASRDVQFAIVAAAEGAEAAFAMNTALLKQDLAHLDAQSSNEVKKGETR